MEALGIIRRPDTGTTHIPTGPGARHDAEGLWDLLPEFAEGLPDSAGCSHLCVLWVFDRTAGDDRLVTPPTATRPHGVFAPRAPRRPTPIGLTVVPWRRREGPRLHVRGIDMRDGSPILGLRPDLSSGPAGHLRRGWRAEEEPRR